ncbi:UNVERIFIED_CONTAM: Germin-like protein subfamily T member 1 [Sesamum calycinum]|uniref:Germin-like protein subfamily T member 1 n=1 Tax=Sesamum calycinum TaxID=2727403 RepID=A0AAW2PMR4_9LAMI
MFVIPRGLVHFQLNVGQEKALIFTAFNSHLPGAVVLPLNLFASTPSVPDNVLTKAFQNKKDKKQFTAAVFIDSISDSEGSQSINVKTIAMAMTVLGLRISDEPNKRLISRLWLLRLNISVLEKVS